MKKIIGILLIMLLLVGCSSTTANQASKNDKETKNEKVNIKFWHALGGSLGDGLLEILDKYNSSQDKYVVEPVTIGSYSEIDEKLQAAYAAKTVPSLVAGGSYEMFYKKGLVEAFEDYITDEYDKEDIVGGFMTAALREGKMFFAPAYGTSQVLYYDTMLKIYNHGNLLLLCKRI